MKVIEGACSKCNLNNVEVALIKTKNKKVIALCAMCLKMIMRKDF